MAPAGAGGRQRDLAPTDRAAAGTCWRATCGSPSPLEIGNGELAGYTYFVTSATVKPCAWMCL